MTVIVVHITGWFLGTFFCQKGTRVLHHPSEMLTGDAAIFAINPVAALF